MTFEKELGGWPKKARKEVHEKDEKNVSRQGLFKGKERGRETIRQNEERKKEEREKRGNKNVKPKAKPI